MSFPASCVCLEQGLLRSAGITLLPHYYEPIRHPVAPGLSLAGVRLVLSTTQQGFPCCCCFPLPYMLSPIPRRNPRLLIARFIWDVGLPQFCAGSASALSFSRPARRS